MVTNLSPARTNASAFVSPSISVHVKKPPLNSSVVIAQISDSHLFSDIEQCHFQANVYQNLCSVLTEITNSPEIDVVIFTGDLTQDHSEASYQRFCDAVLSLKINIPFYFLAGNHDEPILLNKILSDEPFLSDKLIETSYWQILLVDSKSDTPKGKVTEKELKKLKQSVNSEKHQLVLMHHHPVNVGYFIDQDHLQDKISFWQTINDLPSIKVIGCGHVHQGLTLPATSNSSQGFEQSIPVYTCPATSIQFDMNAAKISASKQGAGYRLWTLAENGQYTTQVKFLTKAVKRK